MILSIPGMTNVVPVEATMRFPGFITPVFAFCIDHTSIVPEPFVTDCGVAVMVHIGRGSTGGRTGVAVAVTDTLHDAIPDGFDIFSTYDVVVEIAGVTNNVPLLATMALIGFKIPVLVFWMFQESRVPDQFWTFCVLALIVQLGSGSGGGFITARELRSAKYEK